MRLSKHKREMNARMNMTPMIDIVFLLIIFFMTVNQISEVNKAPVELAKQKGSSEQDNEVLIINVDKAGEIYMFGDRVNMPQMIIAVSNEISKRGGPERVKVALRIDRNAESKVPNEIIKSLGGLGVTHLRTPVSEGN